MLLVESARGAAAAYVCFHHVDLIGHLAESFSWGKYLFYPLNFGQEAVFLFFFLSGFSIHYSSHDRPLQEIGGICHFYYLRLRRIYPIFLFAIVLSVALCALAVFLGLIPNALCHTSGRDLFFVVFFLSDIHDGTWCLGLPNNPALWSLAYEIPYYLVYPAFWMSCKRFGTERTFAFTCLGSVAFMLAGCLRASHISSVFCLYWLWTGGALMAEWKLTGKRFLFSPVSYYFALFLCCAASQSVEAVAKPLLHWNLEALTIGIVVFSTYIDFKPVLPSMRLVAAGGTALLLLFSLWVTRNVPTWGRHMFLNLRLVSLAAFVAWLLVTGANVASLCRILAEPFLKLGAISYALYVVHMPILYFAADALHHAGMSFFWTPVALLLIFPLAWWLEIKFQRFAAGLLDMSRARLAPVFQ